jgi:hypothetical protein
LVFLSGCSRQYEIKVVNQGTNNLVLLTMTWDGNEVPVSMILVPKEESRQFMGGWEISDRTVIPQCRMPTNAVVFHYLTAGSTNDVRVEIPKEVVAAMQESHSNFLFIFNTNGTITPTLSAQSK